MPEERYMVCMRVDELDDPVDGSTTTACVDCGTDIWISAESRKKMYEVQAMPLCSSCAQRIAKESGNNVIEELSDGQAAEIMEKIAAQKPEWHAALHSPDVDNFEALKATAEMAGEAMKHPGDNWGSMCVMEDYSGNTYPPVPMEKMLRDGVPKEVIAKQLLPAMIQAAQIRRVIFGLCPHGDGEMDEPGTADALWLIDITAEGVQQVSVSHISRTGPTPKLGEWLSVDTSQMENGLFIDCVLATLQLVHSLR